MTTDARSHETHSWSRLTSSTSQGMRGSWKRMSTQSKRRLMSSGGFLSDLSIPISLAVIAESAASASSSAGFAASRSASTIALSSPMASASTERTSFTDCTSAFFFSARAVEVVISCSSWPLCATATASTFSFSRSSIFITSTSADACSSLIRPLLIEVASSSTLEILLDVHVAVQVDEAKVRARGHVRAPAEALEEQVAPVVDHLVHLAHVVDERVAHHLGILILDIELAHKVARDRREGLLGPREEPVDGAAVDEAGELLGALQQLRADG